MTFLNGVQFMRIMKYGQLSLHQAIHITTANVSDRDGASAMLALNSEHLSQVSTILVDGGYTGANFLADVDTNLKATVQVAKRNELHKFEVLPQR